MCYHAIIHHTLLKQRCTQQRVGLRVDWLSFDLLAFEL